jgi:asparagine synthase (glutamine-hydrolysing)
MCGICLVWNEAATDPFPKYEMHHCVTRLMDRGPDEAYSDLLTLGSGIRVGVGFTRLHVQGAAGQEQPFRLADGRIIMCNGEIFNSAALVSSLKLAVPRGASDCAVIPALLATMDLAAVCRLLDGDFAIVVLDPKAETVSVARDPYGVRPLFIGSYESGISCIVSELKGFPHHVGVLTSVTSVAPGTVTSFSLAAPRHATTQTWHQPPWLKSPHFESMEVQIGPALQFALEAAVVKRLATVREVGACLSGGLDSSLVAAIAARNLTTPLHTYSIGMEGSPDLEKAREVAAHIGSIHHERIVTAEECLDAIPRVIKSIESFDITTVRASVGNYLLGAFIRRVTPTVKVILNGDGADEILGGYLYMRSAPSDAAFEAETSRLLDEIHRFDVLRSERSMAAHGLESRSPFLDRQFISVARSLPTRLLRPTAERMEKYVLRAAFATSGLLPESVLWRRKEAFSDGISHAEKSWFETAKQRGEDEFPSGWTGYYTMNPPKTGEAAWYRSLFHESYPEAAAALIPAMWMPRFIEGATDPSARTLALYGPPQ